MKGVVLCCLCIGSCLGSPVIFAQRVGINTTTPHASAAVDINATNGGLLIPRMTTAQRLAIINAATGLLVFDNTTHTFWLKQPAGWTELATITHSALLKSVNGSAQFDTLPKNRRKYMWELNAAHPFNSSIPLPESITTELCGDEDGCRITMSMSHWSATNTEATGITGLFFYGPANNNQRRWRFDYAGGTNTGVDGDGAATYPASLYSMAYLSDGPYLNGSGQDTGIGLHFFRFNGGYAASTIVRLWIED